MATTERLEDFPAKATPTPADIIYVGDAADANNEVKSTIAQIIAAYPALASIAGLTTAADTMIYTTASNVYATTPLTAFGRSLIDDAAAVNARSTLGLVIGTNVQAQNAALSSIAGLTTIANNLIVTTAADTYAVIAPVNSAIFRSSSTGVPGWSASLTNGQLMIGSTGANPVLGTLTAGAGISIAVGAGTITISGTGSGIGWTEVTGTTQAMTADSAWVANNAGLVTLTLPVTAAFGTAIVVLGKGAGGWSIAQNSGQNIQVGSSSSTVGAGGSVSSSNRWDSISMICTTANTTWSMYGAPQGNLTIV